MGVVVAGVSTHLAFWTAGIDHTILRNVIVVTDGVETTGLVAGFQGFNWEVLVYTCGTAMYHDQIDFSLILHCFLWIIKNISLAALHAEGAENGGEDSDDEIDDGFPVYFHVISD